MRPGEKFKSPRKERPEKRKELSEEKKQYGVGPGVCSEGRRGYELKEENWVDGLRSLLVKSRMPEGLLPQRKKRIRSRGEANWNCYGEIIHREIILRALTRPTGRKRAIMSIIHREERLLVVGGLSPARNKDGGISKMKQVLAYVRKPALRREVRPGLGLSGKEARLQWSGTATYIGGLQSYSGGEEGRGNLGKRGDAGRRSPLS